MKANPRIQIVGRVPRDLRQAMTRAARQQRISLNRLIEDSLRHHIGGRRAPGPTETK